MAQKNKQIIAFAGRQRSGKSHLAELLKRKCGAKIYTIADYLKLLCCKLIDVDYKTLNELKNNKTELNVVPNVLQWGEIISKETGIDTIKICSELKEIVIIKDARELLQVIGTNIIRKYYPSWHIDNLIKDVLASDSDIIAIDDVRFPNEYEAIKNIGGEVFFIIRTNEVTDDMISNHLSETALKWTDFPNERVILNTNDTKFMDSKFLIAYLSKFNYSLTNPLFLSSQIKRLSENNPLVIEDLKCRIK